MAENANMYLYWGSGSIPSWKAMLALAEKGLWDKCENKMVQFSEKEHKHEELTKLNKRGQVPTFRDGEVVVNESGAICMYLEEKYSNNKLLPAGVDERAQVYQRMFETANIQSIIREKLVYYRWRTKEQEQDKDYWEENIKKAKEELERWNTMLTNNRYLCGENFTMADVFFYPFLAFLERVGLNVSNYRELERYSEEVKQRPTVQATWPPHWKEGNGSDMLKEL